MVNTFTTTSSDETVELGESIGRKLRGGEVFELISDLGGGKTIFVRGLAMGFGSKDPVASPSFAISFVYQNSSSAELHHYDFYRLTEPGIMRNELLEVLSDEAAVVVVEWGEIVKDILPLNSIRVKVSKISENDRQFIFEHRKESDYLFVDEGSDL